MTSVLNQSQKSVIMDSDLHFDSHIKSVTKSAYYHLKNLARLGGLMSTEDLQKLVHAFITSLITAMVSLQVSPKKFLRQLQLIQNAAARVLTKTKIFEHITSKRYIGSLLTYKSLHGLGPTYLYTYTYMLPLHKPTFQTTKIF